MYSVHVQCVCVRVCACVCVCVRVCACVCVQCAIADSFSADFAREKEVFGLVQRLGTG